MSKNLSILNGTKLEYKEKSGNAYTRLYGLKTIPDIGGTPNKIDTTNLDNEEYETNMMGLKPAPDMDFEFDMENPSATANIKKVSDMEDAGTSYDWKLTYSNGIVATWASPVKTTIKGGSSGELTGFTMHLAPEEEIQVTIPTISG